MIRAIYISIASGKAAIRGGQKQSRWSRITSELLYRCVFTGSHNAQLAFSERFRRLFSFLLWLCDRTLKIIKRVKTEVFFLEFFDSILIKIEAGNIVKADFRA